MPLPSTILYPSGGGGGGAGDVVGPGSSTDNAIARWSGAGGTTLQDSVVTVADTSGNMTWPTGTNTTLGLQATNGFGAIISTSGTGSAYLAISSLGAHPIIFNGGTFWSYPTYGPRVPSTTQYGFGSSTSYTGNLLDTGLARSSAGVVKVTDGSTGYGSIVALLGSFGYASGAVTNLTTATTTVNLSGATSTATGLFPAKCIQLGVSYRVTTAVTSGDGGTSFTVGDGSDPDRYGSGIAFTLGTTGKLSQATADPRGWSASAGDVVFTCTGGTFSGGVVRVVAHYIDLTAPTS